MVSRLKIPAAILVFIFAVASTTRAAAVSSAGTQDFSHVVVIDIDACKRSVMYSMLANGDLPNLGRIAGRVAYPGGTDDTVDAVFLDSVGVNYCTNSFPTVTLVNHATLYTGCVPASHGVVGNELFDRLGTTNEGTPRFYAFTAGQGLALQDTLGAYAGQGLANRMLDRSTVYESASVQGVSSLISFNMYSSQHHLLDQNITWIVPALGDFINVGLAELSVIPEIIIGTLQAYDRAMMVKALEQLGTGDVPNIMTLYFAGFDVASHKLGPDIQPYYLRNVVDPLIGLLLDGDRGRVGLIDHPLWDYSRTAFVITSDHGQTAVGNDDLHAISLYEPTGIFGTEPYEGRNEELVDVFDSLGLVMATGQADVADSDVLVGVSCVADVYVRAGAGTPVPPGWTEFPAFATDVLPVADALWRASFAPDEPGEMTNAIELVLVRDSGTTPDWCAPYRVYTGGGAVEDIADYLARHPELDYVDPVRRIAEHQSVYSGDILLFPSYRDGYYFGTPMAGNHGTLYADDSYIPFIIASPGNRLLLFARTIETARAVDLTPTIGALLGFVTFGAEGIALAGRPIPCFIATAVYGGETEQVAQLRRLRDEVLLRNQLGASFVRQYYTWSPMLSDGISAHPAAKAVVRAALDLFVVLASGRYVLLACVVVGLLVAVRRRSRRV